MNFKPEINIADCGNKTAELAINPAKFKLFLKVFILIRMKTSIAQFNSAVAVK